MDGRTLVPCLEVGRLQVEFGLTHELERAPGFQTVKTK